MKHRKLWLQLTEVAPSATVAACSEKRAVGHASGPVMVAPYAVHETKRGGLPALGSGAWPQTAAAVSGASTGSRSAASEGSSSKGKVSTHWPTRVRSRLYLADCGVILQIATTTLGVGPRLA